MVKRIAVVGANGFLGKSLVDVFLKQGYAVVAVYNQSKGALINENLIWMKWTEFLQDHPSIEVIVYAASIIPYGFMNEHDDAMLKVNALNPFELRQLYSDVHFIYISSVSVYAHSKEAIHERSAKSPQGAYAESKLAGELISKGFSHCAILRCSSIYGPGMNANTFIPRCLKQAKENGVISIYGDGTRHQNYIHVDDVAQLCLKIVEQDIHGDYLAVFPESIENIAIASAISNQYHCKIEFVGTDDSPSFFYDATKTYETLNFIPKRDSLTEINYL
jgi:nucleoside-diphosphate-sugar epimerase